MTQQLVLDPLGIMTEPNKLGQTPAGSMSTASCTLRSPGIIGSLPTWVNKAGIASDASTTAVFVITPPGPLMLAIFNSGSTWFYSWHFQVAGGTAFGATALSFTLGVQPYPQSIPLGVQPGFSYVIHGKQLLVNMFSTVIVWDTYEPANSLEATPRPAGLFPPQMQEILGFNPGTALAGGTYAHYISIYKRQVGDTLLLSAPSPAMPSRAGVPTDGHNIRVEVEFSSLVKAGDILEIYRTKSKPTNGTGIYYTFQKAEEAGAEYQKATSVVLTAAHISAGNIQVFDKTADANLGEALYTNQAIGGLGAQAFPPPALRFMTSHKGYVFGFGTTMPPSITLRPTGTWAPVFGDTAQAQSGFGSALLSGCSWSAGGTTVTPSPSSQLGFVKLGMAVFGTGLSGNVTAIGGSTFTFTPAATLAGVATLCTVTDVFQVDGSTNFSDAWRFFPINIATLDELMLIAPALKLPGVTPSNFVAQPTDGFTIRRKMLNDARTTFGVKSSGEQNWDPDIQPYQGVATTSATIENKPRSMVWSDQDQPESWPFVDEDTFARGLPCAFASTRDCIIAFYTDAIWRISGTGGTAKDGYDWRADPIATNITICGSQAICVLNDVVYAMTSEGLIAIDNGSSARNISKGRVHNQLATPPWSDGPYTVSTACFLVADEENGEILMREPSAAAGVMWVYNIATDTLVRTAIGSGEGNGPFHADYSRTLRAPVVAVKTGVSTWQLQTYSTAASGVDLTYQQVYSDNPFAQRQWQSVDLVVENDAGGNNYMVSCNGVAASLTNRPLINGRVSFEVPRNAPAIGNTMAIRVQALAAAGFVRILGIALNFRDQTDRRRNR